MAPERLEVACRYLRNPRAMAKPGGLGLDHLVSILSTLPLFACKGLGFLPNSPNTLDELFQSKGVGGRRLRPIR